MAKLFKTLEERTFSRRSFLKGSLVCMASTSNLNSILGETNETETEAEIFLNEFPDNIPGSKEIIKYPASGARYCMVHLKQAHFVPLIGSNRLLKETNLPLYRGAVTAVTTEVNKIQANIYDILKFMLERYKIGEVFLEGVAKEKDRNEINLIYHDVLGFICEEIYGEISKDTAKKVLEQYPYAPGAALVLARDGKLKILPAEDEEANRRAIEIANMPESDFKEEAFRKARRSREHSALARVISYKKPISVIVFGGEHKFDYLIGVWNKKYGDAKFSLIEITPEGYGYK